MDNEHKISVTAFEPKIALTNDHVYYGILKRTYKNSKLTEQEWFELLTDLKSGSVKVK